MNGYFDYDEYDFTQDYGRGLVDASEETSQGKPEEGNAAGDAIPD